MQFEYTDSNGDTQTVSAGASRFVPVKKPNTHYATADSGNALEVTHLGYRESIQLTIPFITEVELPGFIELCDSLETKTITVTDQPGDIVLFNGRFPVVCRRQADAMPFPEYISTCNKFRLVLDLLIVG